MSNRKSIDQQFTETRQVLVDAGTNEKFLREIDEMEGFAKSVIKNLNDVFPNGGKEIDDKRSKRMV